MANALTTEERERIIELYRSGLKIVQIAARTGHWRCTVRHVLRAAGMPMRPRPAPRVPRERIEEMMSRYAAGESTSSITTNPAEQGAIWREAKRRSISRPPGPIPTPCNGHFFDIIDTEPKAYWLGFIAADGCVSDKYPTRRIVIGLAGRDASHLWGFLEDIESLGRVRIGKRGVGQICVTNNTLADGLASHGIVPRKSLSLIFPTTVPDKLMRHFVRGYFDGDGCISPTNHGTLDFIGTTAFVTTLQGVLNSGPFAGLKAQGSVKTHRHAPGISSLQYSIGPIHLAYPYLYDGATRYLERKHAIFRSLVSVPLKRGAYHQVSRPAENAVISTGAPWNNPVQLIVTPSSPSLKVC